MLRCSVTRKEKRSEPTCREPCSLGGVVLNSRQFSPEMPVRQNEVCLSCNPCVEYPKHPSFMDMYSCVYPTFSALHTCSCSQRCTARRVNLLRLRACVYHEVQLCGVHIRVRCNQAAPSSGAQAANQI